MATIYFVRHQAAGVLHEYPFSQEPTESQVEALEKLCFQSHGAIHPKSKDPYWLVVVPVQTFGANDVPVVPDRSLSVASEADTEKFEISAMGHTSKK